MDIPITFGAQPLSFLNGADDGQENLMKQCL